MNPITPKVLYKIQFRPSDRRTGIHIMRDKQKVREREERERERQEERRGG